MKTIRHFCLLLLAGASLSLLSCSSSKTASDGGSSAPARSEATVQQLLDRMEPGRAREYFIQGSVLQMQKRHAEAIIEFQQALRYDNSPALHYALAMNYRELSKPELAIEHLRTAVAMDTDFHAAYHLLGEIYISQFRLDDAIEVYEHLDAAAPSSLVRFTLARIYEFRDVERAIQLYNEMLQDKEDFTVLERLADIYEEQGDTARSVAILERLYRLAPDNESIPPVLLQRYIQQSQYERGLALLEEIDNTLPSAQVQRYYLAVGGNLLRDLAVSPTATAGHAATYIARTEGLFPDAWQVHLMRGMIAGELGDTALSDRLFSATLDRADSVPEVPLQVIVFYLQEQRFAAMENVTNRYERRFTDDPRFPFFAALAFSRQQRSSEAIGALRRSLAADSQYVEAWVQLGIEYSQADSTAQSDAAYERALELDPGNALANNNYAYALSERGEQLERALAMTQIALKDDPDNPSYLDTMGWIYYQLGEYDQALDYITRAIAAGDASATVYEHLGDVHDKLGNTDEAVEAWRKALEIEPDRESTRSRLNTRQ